MSVIVNDAVQVEADEVHICARCAPVLMNCYVGCKGPHHLQLFIEVLVLHHLDEGLELLLEPLAVFGGQHEAQPHVSPLYLNGLLQLPDHLQGLWGSAQGWSLGYSTVLV